MAELLQAMLVATDDRKRTALHLLRGERQEEVRPDAVEAYVTLKEVSQRLGVSSTSLWRWGIPGHALGGRRRYRMSEVQRYLESEAFALRAAALKAERAKGRS